MTRAENRAIVDIAMDQSMNALQPENLGEVDDAEIDALVRRAVSQRKTDYLLTAVQRELSGEARQRNERMRGNLKALWNNPLGVAFWLGLCVLVGYALLAGCGLSGPLPVFPNTTTEGGSGEGSGGSSEGSGSSGSSGTAFEGESTSDSTGGSSGGGSGGSTGSSDEAVCAVEGLECLCSGAPADPFECVDECLWVDGIHCMCDGMTSPPEWCEAGEDTGDSTT